MSLLIRNTTRGIRRYIGSILLAPDDDIVPPSRQKSFGIPLGQPYPARFLVCHVTQATSPYPLEKLGFLV